MLARVPGERSLLPMTHQHCGVCTCTEWRELGKQSNTWIFAKRLGRSEGLRLVLETSLYPGLKGLNPSRNLVREQVVPLGPKDHVDRSLLSDGHSGGQ